jgi:NAD(P)H-quinone oxidoreductase subunit 5
MGVVQVHSFYLAERYRANNEFHTRDELPYLPRTETTHHDPSPGAPAMIHLLPLLAPIALVTAALYLRGRPAPEAARLGEWATMGVLGLSLLVAVTLVAEGGGSSPLLGAGGLGLSARVDAVSVVLMVLVAFVGWIVTRYARTYMDGEAGQPAFTAWLLATLAAVLAMVTAGNVAQFAVAWIASGLTLGRLLLFYADRLPARRAARKMALTARLGDAAVIGAAMALVAAYGTGDIAEILIGARLGQGGGAATVAAVLIALAALLKSAQIPFHGWLTEVMEAPTPVSALLHAGVINAGGVILIRFADVMILSPLVMAALVALGGVSALLGGLVMLTQPAVKTSLAWSTVAQMGFMVMQCGLALFPLALLHVVAHSLYKAHAFLSSGGAVQLVAGIRRPGPVAVPSMTAVGRAFAVALAIFGAVFFAQAAIFGLDAKSPQAIALGAILILGVAYLLAQGLADAAPRELTRRTALMSAGAAVAYFALQTLATAATAGILPPVPAPGPLEWALIGMAVVSFGAVALAQATFASWAGHPAAEGLRVHMANGLYLNALTDRLTATWSAPTTAPRTGESA